MALVTLNSATQTAPGVYVFENAAGPIPQAIASFNRVYYVGSATGGTANTPTQITSRTDFENVFTSSTAVNLNNLDFFFRNLPAGIFWYVKAAAAPVTTITLGGATDGTYTVTLNGEDNAFVASSNSAQEIIEGLVTAINDNTDINTAVQAEYEIDAAGENVFSNNRFYVRSLNPAVTFTATTSTTGSTLTATAVAAPAALNYWDYIYALNNSFNEEMDQGFLVCPEAFYSLTLQYERTQVATTMENVAATTLFDWMAFADSGTPGTIDTKAEVKTEGMLYTTSRGHLAYFCPWLKDTDNDDVSPALAAAIVGLRRYAAEGFAQPPAGTAYPLRGVSDVRFDIYQAERADLNANGINVIRNIKGVGVAVYGSRTRSTNPFYKFINTRIVLNVFSRTVFEALTNGNLLFSLVDGQGVLFNRIKETVDQIAYRFWAGGAFFGATPEAAFKVICSLENNSTLDLEDGLVRVDAYVAPSPTMERLFVAVTRVSINQVISQGVS